MSNVIIDKQKIDILANAISVKSGEPVTMTLDEMVTAVDGIETGGGEPTLETVTKTYTPSTSQQTDTITPSQGYDGIEEVDVTINAVATGTAGTPTASKGTVSNHSVSVTPSVTNTAGYISGGTINGTAVSVSASELVSGTYTVDSAGTKDVTNYASASVPSGTAGTPSASKGTVSNHSVTVTPSVTNQTGWITGSTKTGTGVTVSASELASGNKEITANGTNIDVVGYSTVSVNVSGGGGNPVQVDNKYNDDGGDRTSISFSVLGEPTSFALYADNGITLPSGTPYKTIAVVYDGTSHHAQILTNTSNAQASYDGSSFSHTYSNGTLTVSSTGAHFTDADWVLLYSYDGTSANIHTADVQVGSGATSITFTGLEDEPLYWSCIFKSNFGTSSGYQRVIFTSSDGNAIEGSCLDSQSRYSSSYWTSSYSNGSLTITSNGTNAGGYFHQPGYYQLTYVIGEASLYEKVSKTYRASTTAQSEKIEPSTGYDAMSEVNISIPAVSQTNLTAANIKSGTTVTISNGSTNLWSVTGTYSGGGGANIATATMTNSSNQNTSIDFTLPSGRTPKAFFARLTSQIARNSNSRYYYVYDMRWDGSSTGGVAGNTFYMYNGTLTNVTSGYSYSQSGTTFTLSSTGSRSASPGSFFNGTYELVYVY